MPYLLGNLDVHLQLATTTADALPLSIQVAPLYPMTKEVESWCPSAERGLGQLCIMSWGMGLGILPMGS